MNSIVDFTDSVSKCNKKLSVIKDPTELFKKCRILLTHFVPASAPENADNTVTAQLLDVLHHMQRAAKASTPGQRDIEEIGKSVDTMLVIVCRSEYKQEVKVVIFNTVECLFAVLDFEELQKMRPTFFPNLKNIGRLFEKKNKGLAMLSCLKMALEYVCKFPSDQKAKQLRKLSTSLQLHYEQLLKLNAEWGKPDIDQKCRQVLNQLDNVKFYLLAVFGACCRRNAMELKPLAGRKYFIVEWNNSSMRLSFTCLTKNGSYDMDIPYDNVEEYRFIRQEKEEFFLEITGGSFDIRLDLVSALDFYVLRDRLSPIMGNKDRSLPEPSESKIMHINLDSSVSKMSIMRPVDLAHKFASTVTAGTWRPSTVEYSMENDANATVKATERPAERDGSRPAPAAAAGATETEQLLSDSQLNLYGNEYIRLNGSVGVEQLAKKTGNTLQVQRLRQIHERVKGNALRFIRTDAAPKDGGKKPCVDPYELDQARYDEGVVSRIPAAEGKKPRRSKKATQPPAAKTVVTSTNAPTPSMVQAIAKLRRQKVSTPKRPSTPFANVASHFRSSRDVSPINATDSDDSGSDASWNPQSLRRKKPTKPRKMNTVTAATTYRRKDVQTVSTVKVNQQGRRQSFTLRQSIETTYNLQDKEPQGPPQQQPDSAILSESDVSFEEVEEIKRRLKNNDIFASESSNSSQPPPTPLPTAGGRKRKFCFDSDQRKVANTTTTTTTTTTTMAGKFATDEQGSDNESNGAHNKHSYVIENIVHPTVQKLHETVDQHLAEAKGSVEAMLGRRQARLDVLMEKHRTLMQHQNAVNETFAELMQMVLEFKRDRPSEADMEQKIKQASENDQQLRGKLLAEQALLEQQIQNAQLFDWDFKVQRIMAVLQGVMSRTRCSIMME